MTHEAMRMIEERDSNQEMLQDSDLQKMEQMEQMEDAGQQEQMNDPVPEKEADKWEYRDLPF